jgi:hypothetical protein
MRRLRELFWFALLLPGLAAAERKTTEDSPPWAPWVTVRTKTVKHSSFVSFGEPGGGSLHVTQSLRWRDARNHEHRLRYGDLFQLMPTSTGGVMVLANALGKALAHRLFYLDRDRGEAVELATETPTLGLSGSWLTCDRTRLFVVMFPIDKSTYTVDHLLVKEFGPDGRALGETTLQNTQQENWNAMGSQGDAMLAIHWLEPVGPKASFQIWQIRDGQRAVLATGTYPELEQKTKGLVDVCR